MSTSNDNSNGSNGDAKDTLLTGQVRAGLTDARLTRELIAELDAAVDAIDGSTASRLASARREALAQVPGKRSISLFGTPWATAAAGLAASLVVVLLWFEPVENSADLIATDSGLITLESLPILTSSEDLEFFQSVDFLVWMEKNSV